MTNPSTNPDTRLSDERLAEMLAAWEAQSNHARLGHGMNMHELEIVSALTELQALRAPAETEPVAWRYAESDIEWGFSDDPTKIEILSEIVEVEPLFTHPLRNPSPSDWEVSDYEIALMVKAAKKKAPTYWSEVRDADIVWIKVIRAAVAALQASKRGQP